LSPYAGAQRAAHGGAFISVAAAIRRSPGCDRCRAHGYSVARMRRRRPLALLLGHDYARESDEHDPKSKCRHRDFTDVPVIDVFRESATREAGDSARTLESTGDDGRAVAHAGVVKDVKLKVGDKVSEGASPDVGTQRPPGAVT